MVGERNMVQRGTKILIRTCEVCRGTKQVGGKNKVLMSNGSFHGSKLKCKSHQETEIPICSQWEMGGTGCQESTAGEETKDSAPSCQAALQAGQTQLKGGAIKNENDNQGHGKKPTVTQVRNCPYKWFKTVKARKRRNTALLKAGQSRGERPRETKDAAVTNQTQVWSSVQGWEPARPGSKRRTVWGTPRFWITSPQGQTVTQACSYREARQVLRKGPKTKDSWTARGPMLYQRHWVRVTQEENSRFRCRALSPLVWA